MSIIDLDEHYDYEIEPRRARVRDGLVDAEHALTEALRALNELASDTVYDIEVAEASLDPRLAVRDALLGVAAAKHLTRMLARGKSS